MQRIFLAPEQIHDGLAHITCTDHLHLARVLRTRVGEAIVVLDGQGNAFRAELVTIGKNESAARIVETVPVAPEPPIHLTIVQALGKGDKFEQVVQHGTEAGASAFVPLRAERCVADVPVSKEEERKKRWRQIAKNAAEQSARGIIPTVSYPISFSLLVKSAKQLKGAIASDKPLRQTAIEQPEAITPLLMLHTDASATPLKTALPALRSPYFLALAIGPEGGWSEAEIKAAEEANIPFVSLGPRVLRTETAALVAISQILYHFDMV